MQLAQNEQSRYVAFISYRHRARDTEVAKRVQDAIETFRLPRDIAASYANDRKLGKCFRDEDELAAAHSLPERILDALESSSALIVICSPEARQSAWIEREISAFIALHGRDRIFTVLAEGSSADSIPDSLRTTTVLPGEIETGSNPLAADLRPAAAGKEGDELLRIIAALAGCGYDDLKQREKTRKRKKGAAILLAGIAAAICVFAAVAFTSHAQTGALESESRQLAAESSQLLERGDRYGAIVKALEGLPESQSSNDRPLVPEAKTALEQALEINPNPNSAWDASYEITTTASLGLIENSMARGLEDDVRQASAIAVSDEGEFFAVSDADGCVRTYDTLTGRLLTECEMPDGQQPSEDEFVTYAMSATEHYLVASRSHDSGSTLACFDARSGNQLWAKDGTGWPSFDNSYGDDLLSMAFPLADGGYSVSIADLANNQLSSFNVATDGGATEKPLDTSTPYFNTPGARFGKNYAAFGNRLFAADGEDGKSTSCELAYANVTSLSYLDDMVIASSAEPMPDDDIKRNFAIEAFSDDLKRKWRYDASFTSEMIENNGIRSFLTGEPVVQGITGAQGGIVVSAGREVVVLDPATGEVDERFSFDQTVLEACPVQGSQDEPGFLIIACSNGTVNCRNLLESAQDSQGDSRRLALPFPLRWARIAHCGDYDALLAIPADSDNRIVCYRTDWSREAQGSAEYSLDELIARANEVLSDAGIDR